MKYEIKLLISLPSSSTNLFHCRKEFQANKLSETSAVKGLNNWGGKKT